MHLGLCVVSLVAVLLVAAVTLRSVSFVSVSWSDLVETCRNALLSGFSLSAFLALALGLLSTLVLWRGVRSAVHRVRASRRFESSLPEAGWLASDPSVRVFRDPSPHAFCAGLLRPRVFVSNSAVEHLTQEELAAVLTHERHHARLRDPLRLMAAGVLADALFFLPAIRHIRERYATVAELAADEAVVTQPGGREALASAMLAFGETPHGSVVGLSNERVDHLLDGGPLRWRLRISLLVTTLVALGLLYASVLVIGSAGQDSIQATGLIMQLCFVYLVVFAVMAVVGLLKVAPVARGFIRQG